MLGSFVFVVLVVVAIVGVASALLKGPSTRPWDIHRGALAATECTDIACGDPNGGNGPAPTAQVHTEAASHRSLSNASLQSAKNKIEEAVSQHLPTLARRRMALIKFDHYGVVDTTGWHKERQYFADNVILPKLTRDEAFAVAEFGLSELLTQMLEGPAQRECARLEANYVYSDEMSPLDYERFCAVRLEGAGWSCELTKISGDQGADIIARKNGIIIVLQCKRYTSPVGNGAVQEVIAAKNHLRAHYAAVVSNAPYTKSALELANSTRTLLLHHVDLDVIDARLGLHKS